MFSPEMLIATICPSLAGSPSLSVYVEMASIMTSQDFFGPLYARAVALRASHMFTMDTRALGASGAIAGLQEGKLSVRYQASADSSDLGQTGYGKSLQTLMSSRPKMGVNSLYGGPI